MDWSLSLAKHCTSNFLIVISVFLSTAISQQFESNLIDSREKGKFYVFGPHQGPFFLSESEEFWSHTDHSGNSLHHPVETVTTHLFHCLYGKIKHKVDAVFMNELPLRNG